MARKSALGREPSCCLQDAVWAGPGAKPRQRNALDPKPRCCLQDAPADAFGPGVAAARDSVRPPEDGSGDSLSSSLGGLRATCADSLNTPTGKPHQKRSSLGDSRADVVAGRRVGYRRLAEDENEKVGRVAGNNSNDDHSSAGLRDQNASGLILSKNPARTEVSKFVAL